MGNTLTGCLSSGGSYHSTRFANPTSVDPRVSLFPFEFFKGKRVLDVGCNEGWLTVDIGKFLFRALETID